MADNTTLTAGAGGDTVATDDIGGVKYQRVKLVEGADGVNDGDVSSANPLPVERIGDGIVVGKAADGAAVAGNPVLIAGQDGTNVQSIKTDTSGELQVDVLTLPALVASSANIGDVDVLTLPALVAGSANIGDVDVLTVPAPLNVVGGGAEATALRVTLANDMTALVVVTGTVAAEITAIVAAPLDVVGGGTEAAALRVTIANDSTGVLSVDDNAGSLTIDGTVSANLNAGSNNIGDVDVLTVPVPLSTTGNGTAAAALRVSIASDTTGVLAVTDNSGSLTTDGTTFALSAEDTLQDAVFATGNGSTHSVTGYGTTVFSITGTFAATITFEISADAGTTWVGLSCMTIGGTDIVTTATAPGLFRATVSGCDLVRARVTWTSGTSVTVKARSTNAAISNRMVRLGSSTNNIGDVDVLTLPALVAGTANIGDVDVLTLPAIPTGTNTIGSVKITDGTDVVDVLDLTNSNPITVAIVDGSGDQIISFGGGTQYTEGDTDATITGTASMMEVAANVLQPVQGTVADGLLVNLGTNNDIVVTTLPSLVAGSANIGDVDVLTLPALVAGTANIGDVDVLTLPALVAGTANIGDVDIVTMPNVTLAAGTNTNEVVGDAAHDAPSAGNPLLTGGYASAAAPAAVSADADAVNAWYLRNGAAATVVTAAGALIGGDAANGLDVDVTRLPALVAGTANIGDVDVLTVPAPLNVVNGGAEATALRVTIANDSTGVLSIDDNAGTLTVDQATASNLNAQVVGSLAHDAVESGNPVSVSGIARTANPTAVAALDRAEFMTDTLGKQVVYPFAPRDLCATQHTQIASSSSETTICSATASEHHDISNIVITNQTATAVNVTIKDATAGTTRAIFALAASGGISVPFTVPWIQTAATNNNWTATLSSASVTVNFLVNFVKAL